MNISMEPWEFKSWFGKSKIVDAEGKPMTAYHGTTSPIDFDEFSTEGAPTDNEGNAIIGSSGDPNAYLGAHFAIGSNAAEVANKFAVNKEGWMRSRYEGESPKPRVIPAYLKIENPIKFKSESGLNDFIYRNGKISNDILLDEAAKADGIADPEEGGPEIDAWLEKYDKDPDFRKEQNEWIFKQDSGALGYEDSSAQEEAAAELGQQAKSALRAKGHDGILYKNDVEGGYAAIAFDPEQIKSGIQNKAVAKTSEQ
jgi:ADP-Ribosyltransferase in polyvalent proteins